MEKYDKDPRAKAMYHQHKKKVKRIQEQGSNTINRKRR